MAATKPLQAPSQGAQIIRLPIPATRASDELNLCEFPLAVLSDRAPKDTFELQFADSVFDESTNKRISRKLTVSAPPKYGLPTAKDEDVILALMHLTQQVNQFTSPTVHFSRYELIKLLGWNEGGKSYVRLTDSLARWKAVTLDYRNAWRDHQTNSWVSEIFSIIDNVTIYDADRGQQKNAQFDLPFCSISWNQIFFRSLQTKYTKRLDLNFYLELKTATSKRLYRFLDKRFGSGRHHWQFDLKELAFEHVGLSRNYDTGRIKEKLGPAIAMLESRGFIAPLPREKRYVKQGRNGWRVTFTKSAKPSAPTPVCTTHKQLCERGISSSIAAQLLEAVPNERISKQIEIFDWLVEHRPESLRNPAGFLAESIRRDFAAPVGFESAADRTERHEQQRLAEEQRQKQHRIKQAEHKAECQQVDNERNHLESLRNAMNDAQQKELEQEAIRRANNEQQQALSDPSFRSFQLRALTSQLLLEKYPLDA